MAKKKPAPQEQQAPIDPIMDDEQEQEIEPVEIAAQSMLGHEYTDGDGDGMGDDA